MKGTSCGICENCGKQFWSIKNNDRILQKRGQLRMAYCTFCVKPGEIVPEHLRNKPDYWARDFKGEATK